MKTGERKNSDADKSAPDYGDLGRDCLISSRCSVSEYLVTSHIQELELFNQMLEGFIAAEDQRVGSSYDGPPEDYDGWWIQDIVGNHLRRAFVCASLDATSYHLSHFCQNVAVIARKEAPELSNKPITRAQVFLEHAGFDKSLSASWQELNALYALRNIFVHASGMISNDRRGQRIKRLIEERSVNGISIRSESIELSPTFTAYVSQQIEAFFKSLHIELTKLCERSGG